VGSSGGDGSQGSGSQAGALPAAVAGAGLQMDTDQNDWSSSSLSVVVVGASGDLAKKKIFPALFALYYEGLLPADFQIFGYARSKMTDAEFRDLIARTLTCRIDARAKCAEAQEFFLQRCFYQAVRRAAARPCWLPGCWGCWGCLLGQGAAGGQRQRQVMWARRRARLTARAAAPPHPHPPGPLRPGLGL
jgi:hypothetical protein